jgi:hypothetical protein
MTRYLVLELNASEAAWGEIGAVTAKSAKDAIRLTLAEAGSPAGQYVAVPARSWKPVQVEAVQTTVLKLT